MATGTVKMFNTDKGYGFISRGDGGDDVFVHQSSIADESGGTLTAGQRVEFEVGRGPKGERANNVRAI